MNSTLSNASNSTTLQAAVGGGLASAVLSVLTVQDTVAALVLSTLSPLPIMLAALMIGWIPGLAAAIVASVIVAFFEIHRGGGSTGDIAILTSGIFIHAINLSLPAWGLARLMASAPSRTASVHPLETRKLGRLIAVAVLLCVVAVAVDFGIVIIAAGGFQVATDTMIGQVETVIKGIFTIDNPLPKGSDSHELAKATVAQFPVVAVAIWLSMAAFNLWVAARITRAFGRFPLPWPDLPRCFRVPRLLALVLAASLGLAFAGGIMGLFALIVSSALTFAFAAQGLAMIHDVTRGKSYRLPLLIIVYLLLPSLFVVYALLGLADSGFSVRDRLRPSIGEKI